MTNDNTKTSRRSKKNNTAPISYEDNVITPTGSNEIASAIPNNTNTDLVSDFWKKNKHNMLSKYAPMTFLTLVAEQLSPYVFHHTSEKYFIGDIDEYFNKTILNDTGGRKFIEGVYPDQFKHSPSIFSHSCGRTRPTKAR